MKKVLIINRYGFVWHIDVHAIADNRAQNYAEGDPALYQEEYEYAMNDSYAVHDWFFNNMDYEDIPEQHIRLVSVPGFFNKLPKYPHDLEKYDPDRTDSEDTEVEESVAYVDRVQKELKELRDQVSAHNASLSLRHQADMRGIKMWQDANPGNELVWPDHADLVAFLISKLEQTK